MWSYYAQKSIFSAFAMLLYKTAEKFAILWKISKSGRPKAHGKHIQEVVELYAMLLRATADMSVCRNICVSVLIRF